MRNEIGRAAMWVSVAAVIIVSVMVTRSLDPLWLILIPMIVDS